jgi:hypothetical protein
LGEGNRDGGIGREVEFGVSFAPIPEIRKFVYLRVVGGGKGGVIYLTTAILTGAVVLAW